MGHCLPATPNIGTQLSVPCAGPCPRHCSRYRSGGFRELCLPIARELGVPPKNLFANRMNFQVDDETGEGVGDAGGWAGWCVGGW
jgi:hypothetical protein